MGFPLITPVSGPTVADAIGAPDSGGDLTDLAADPPPVVPSDASVARAKALLGTRSALPVTLARELPGPTVVAEILGSVTGARLADAPDDDPVQDYLDPPLPVIGTTDSVERAVERIGDHTGSVLVAHIGRAVALIDAARITTAATGSA